VCSYVNASCHSQHSTTQAKYYLYFRAVEFRTHDHELTDYATDCHRRLRFACFSRFGTAFAHHFFSFSSVGVAPYTFIFFNFIRTLNDQQQEVEVRSTGMGPGCIYNLGNLQLHATVFMSNRIFERNASAVTDEGCPCRY
jgi:hypothetical protein